MHNNKDNKKGRKRQKSDAMEKKQKYPEKCRCSEVIEY